MDIGIDSVSFWKENLYGLTLLFPFHRRLKEHFTSYIKWKQKTPITAIHTPRDKRNALVYLQS